jgi:hypothetical protein
MEAKDLRIGNLISIQGQAKEIRSVWHHLPNNSNSNPTTGVSVPKKGCSDKCLSIKDIKPIPLTEKWLLRFGFESYDVEYKYASRWLNIEKSENGYVKLADDYFIDSFEFKHVHQLQNLYFALSNEELILNQ